MEKKFNQWIQLLRCTELSGNERIVLALISNYHNNENWDNTSLRTLKKDSGLTAPTIAKCVKVLEDKGLIKTVISTYKKNINATNDYLPNYETIQQMIDKYNSNCVLGMKETCIRDTEGMKEICGMKETYIPNNERMKETCIDVSKNFAYGNERNFTTGMKETCNKYNIKDNIKEEKEIENKENPENPVIENPETNSFSFDSDFRDFKDSPNNLQEEKENPENPVCDSPKSNSDSKSKPYRVNLNYIDDLERQFNGYTDATSPNAAENSPKATANPKTTETQNPKIDEKFRALLFPNPNITSDYIKSLNCSEYKDLNPTILLDLIEAAKQTTLVIDAMNKAIEWLRTFFGTKGMKCIAQVYVYAKQIIKPTNGSEKWFKYASDVRETLSKEIIKYGGGEVLKEVVRNSQVTDVE